MTITVYTDGAAKGNPGPAGWAWWVDDTCWKSGGWARATNNHAELFAACEALRTFESVGGELVIVTDSRYVIDCLTRYIHGWKRNNWVTSKGGPVANRDLINIIDGLANRRGIAVQWRWVKGHATSVGNMAADRYASAAAHAQHSQTQIYHGPGFIYENAGE